MKDDTISRKSAIDALKKAYWDKDLQAAKNDPCVIDAMTDWAIRQIKALPSLDAEHPFEIQDILDYLDTVLHPIISPEHWNVYSELHDMISTLPSAERRGRWEKIELYAPSGDYVMFQCSECASLYFETSSYCPNCGAKNGRGRK